MAQNKSGNKMKKDDLEYKIKFILDEFNKML